MEIKGLDSLMAKLDAMGGNVLEALGEAVKITTQIAKSDAEYNAPVDTGMLVQSLTHGTDVEYNADSVIGTVGTSAYYADYVERGTHNEFGGVRTPPHPYLMPALNANKSTFEYLAKRELQRAIRKAAK